MENCTETQIKAWKCDTCGKIYTDERVAGGCCKQYHCETCGCETPKYRLMCDSCRDKRDYDKATKMSYAEYCEKFPNNMICIGDDFYSELEEIVDEFYDKGDAPEYCWGTEKIDVEIDPDSVLQDLLENSNCEDLEFDNEAYKEFKEFAKNWNEKYGVSYFVQTNIVIPITEELKIK